MIREFALQLLRKLQFKPANGHARSQKEQHQGEADTLDVIMSDATISKQNGCYTEGQYKTEMNITAALDGEKASATEREEIIENSQSQEDDLIHTPYLPERIELPAQKAQVLQHVELLFALSVKVPDFLEE